MKDELELAKAKNSQMEESHYKEVGKLKIKYKQKS